MHRSTDNDPTGARAAMVYHYAVAGTVDHTYARLREQSDAMGEMPDDVHAAAESAERDSPYFWTPVLRDGEPVGG